MAAQCINTDCLHQQEATTFCEVCGSPILINGWLLPTRLLGQPDNPFSSNRAQTFEAINTKTQETVILRVVHSDDARLVKILKDTVFALRQIHSIEHQPNLMALVEGADDSFFTWKIRPEDTFESVFMLVQKVEGPTLREWLDEHGAINEALAVQWLKHLLRAADKLHSEGFIHRDIKPENIIVGSNNQLVLIDFDSIYRIENTFISTLNRSSVMGTKAYMAPEQNSAQPRPSSDYYSIGIVLTELLLGESYARLDRSENKETAEWPETIQISKQLRETLDSLSHPDAFRRPISAKKVLHFLEGADNWEKENKKVQRRRSLRKRGQVVAVALAILTVPIATTSFSAFQDENNQVVQEKDQVIELLAEANQNLSTGNIQEALKLMQTAVEIDPRNVTLLSTLALSQYISGDVESALTNYEKALAIEPNDPIALYDYGITVESVDMDRAVASYQRAIAAANNQNNPFVRTNAMTSLARAYLLRDQTQEAATLLSGLVETTDDPIIQAVILKNQAWANLKLGNLIAAEEQLVRAISLNRRLTDAHCLLAIVKEQQGTDNFEEKVFCQQLPEPPHKPEINRWRERLGITTTDS